jgi:putative addiction module component (TIGR02574 family)
MTERTSDLLQLAMALPEKERAGLACSLIDSLDATVEEGVEAAWDKEIGRRIAEIDSGKAKLIPWEEIRAELESKLPHDK